ncbi:type 1 fimbrial protein [Erwinia endophytica]|uniref:type 1 fimbrial protein n=1 Tax=Erwinia endophytica TaxID=1563158 RepID=UPI001265EE54|nr:type 1 fimbrial protein [Erwinia endophytica]KAB8313326.1 type 1 fimbrial protein [Erwinia endophytica]
MKKQILNMTAMAVTVMGMMGGMSAAHADPGKSAASVEMKATVAKTTCNVVVNDTQGVSTVVADFGTFVPADLTGKVKTSPFEFSKPFTISFADCAGDSVAQDGTVSLQGQGPTAAGSSKTAYGDAGTDQKVGFDLSLTWQNDASKSDITATKGVLDPSHSTVDIYRAKAATTPGDLKNDLPNVTVTPRFFTWNAADVGDASLDTTVSVAVVYN